MEWHKLSMPERAEYIRLGVRNGVYNIEDIRKTYNSYAEGGYTEDTIDWDKYQKDKNYRITVLERFQDKQKKTANASGTFNSPIFKDNDSQINSSDMSRMKRERKEKEDNERIKNETIGMATTIVENTPIIGDIIGLAESASDIKDGNYLLGGIGIATTLLPGSKVFNKIFRRAKISKYIKDKDKAFNIANSQRLDQAKNEALDFYNRQVIPRIDNSEDRYRALSKLNKMSDKIAFKRLNHSEKGRFNNLSKKIYLNTTIGDDNLVPTLVHEYRHSIDSNIPFNNGLKSKISGFYDNFLTKKSTYTNLVEATALNTQMRFMLDRKYRNIYGNHPSVDQLDSYISLLPDSEIKDIVKPLGYSRRYLKQVDKHSNGMMQLRHNLKYIPVAASPLFLYNIDENN